MSFFWIASGLGSAKSEMIDVASLPGVAAERTARRASIELFWRTTKWKRWWSDLFG